MTVQGSDTQWFLCTGPSPGSTPLEGPQPLRPQLARSQASKNQSRRCREQKPACPRHLLSSQREVVAAGVGPRSGLGVAGVGASPRGPALPTPTSRAGSLGHSWDYSDGLTGSHSGLFFRAVILTLRHPSLPSWRTSICSVAFSFVPVFVQRRQYSGLEHFFAQETKVAQQVQFCWSICFRQGSMVTATPTPLRPDVMQVTSLQVSVSGS